MYWRSGPNPGLFVSTAFLRHAGDALLDIALIAGWIAALLVAGALHGHIEITGVSLAGYALTTPTVIPAAHIAVVAVIAAFLIVACWPGEGEKYVRQ